MNICLWVFYFKWDLYIICVASRIRNHRRGRGGKPPLMEWLLRARGLRSIGWRKSVSCTRQDICIHEVTTSSVAYTTQTNYGSGSSNSFLYRDYPWQVSQVQCIAYWDVLETNLEQWIPTSESQLFWKFRRLYLYDVPETWEQRRPKVNYGGRI